MRRTDFIYLLFIFIGGCLSPVISHASTFMPIVTNYTAKDYQAGLQNWALAQGKNGEMYIGNNTGLLWLSRYLVWVGVKFSNAKEEELLINDASQIGSKKFDFSIE